MTNTNRTDSTAAITFRLEIMIELELEADDFLPALAWSGLAIRAEIHKHQVSNPAALADLEMVATTARLHATNSRKAAAQYAADAAAAEAILTEMVASLGALVA